MLSPGDVLSDRYRLDQPIASGGMGEVWRATDAALGRTVAVKVLRPTLLADPGFDARFRAEARMMAALTHPNVVNIFDYGSSTLLDGSTVAYLVMAYVDGVPLSQRIAAAGRLGVAETMSIVAQAAEALHAAHLGGIVHRDVKPANLLVQPNGTVKLVDFGVARSPSVTSVTTANGVLGTAMYMAPEQAVGRPVSPATDIYALGAVTYHCLAGQPPFPGEAALEVALRHVSDEPPPLPADVPAAAQMLVSRAMAKNPAERHTSAAAFAAAARAAATGPVEPAFSTAVPLAAVDPPTSPEMPAVAEAGSPSRRSRARLAAATGAAAVLLAGLVGLVSLLGFGGPAGTDTVDRPTTSLGPAAPAPTQAAANTGNPSRPEVAASAQPARASDVPSMPAPSSAPASEPATSPAAPKPTASPTPKVTPTQPPTAPPSAPASHGPTP